jgi:hypothetical protein
MLNIKYWNQLEDKRVYVGEKWGEIKRKEEDIKPLYIDMSVKSSEQKVNIAILRVKEEQDFIDNILIIFNHFDD